MSRKRAASPAEARAGVPYAKRESRRSRKAVGTSLGGERSYAAHPFALVVEEIGLAAFLR
jgi:hypothetical protein